MVAYTMLYSAAGIAFKAITFSTLRACFVAIRVCSDNIRSSDLTEVQFIDPERNLKVDIMMCHLPLKPKFIQ